MNIGTWKRTFPDSYLNLLMHIICNINITYNAKIYANTPNYLSIWHNVKTK